MPPTVDNRAPKSYHTQRPSAARVSELLQGGRLNYSEVVGRLERAEKLLAEAIAFVPGGHPLGTEYHAYQLEAMDQENERGRS